MGHIGVICPNTPGHVNAMLALADATRLRGHRVTFFLLGEPPHRLEQPASKPFCSVGPSLRLISTGQNLSAWARCKAWRHSSTPFRSVRVPPMRRCRSGRQLYVPLA